MLVVTRSLLLVAVLAAACGAQSSPAEFEDELLATVDQERLLQSVRDLVAIGARMGGTPSGDAAAAYHAKRFEAAGLKPVLTKDPELAAFEAKKLAATASAGGETLELIDGCLALHTPGVAKCELELLAKPRAEKDPAPYALFIEEPAWPDVDLGAAPPRVLLVGCERRNERSTPVLHQKSGLAPTVLSVSKREATWLRSRLAKGVRLSIEADVFDGRGAPVTASADVPSTIKDAPIVLFCAHGDSDSGSPGADDNGSGDAVVDELATVFAKLSKDGLALPFTLRFAVWGSEIHSSGAYFHRIQQDGSAARHVAVINFDQAGTGAERDCIYFEPDNLPLVQPLVRLGLEMAGEHVGKQGCWTEYTSNAGLGGTDSYVFTPGWQHGGAKGDVPAFTLFTAAWGQSEEPAITPGFRSQGWKGTGDRIRVDYSLVYHETGDRPAVTTEAEPWNMVWVAKAAGLLTLRLAGSPETVKKLLER
jgi:hypothetical protein